MKMPTRVIFTALTATALLAMLSGCDQREGAGEQAGKKMDNAVESAGQKTDNAVESAGQKIDNAMDSAGQKIENAGDRIQDAAKAPE